MTPLLALHNVVKCYDTGGSCRVVPLRGVDLEVYTGERIVLLGKSGSGKSTLLNLVGGVDTPTGGTIIFDGHDLAALNPTELAHFRRRSVGFVFQSFNLFPTLTVGENLMLPLDLLGISDEQRARDLLQAVGLDGKWERFPEQLSGGEQQRVAIARALVKQPRLVLADEPTGNLDQDTSNSILELIDDVCRTHNTTLIMATHSEEALRIADRRFRLRSGLLMEMGLAREATS
ncbi:MAG: ABC transporter ATP-binding protein [Thermodesulfobacteriota bacterium]